MFPTVSPEFGPCSHVDIGTARWMHGPISLNLLQGRVVLVGTWSARVILIGGQEMTVVTKPYKFIGFGDIHGPKPYEFIGFGDIHKR